MTNGHVSPMTIAEFLNEHFGNAHRIQGLEDWGSVTLAGAYFPIDVHGAIKVASIPFSVVIVVFMAAEPDRGDIYLAIDRSSSPPHICLVQSG